MIRSFGVARVMSVKAMQILVSVEMRSSNAWLPIGFCSALVTAVFSSAKPSMCAGSMTVVRSSGTSMGRWPEPYARLTFIRNASGAYRHLRAKPSESIPRQVVRAVGEQAVLPVQAA